MLYEVITDARHLIDCMDMAPQKAVCMPMPAFTEQVQIEVRELWRKTVGIMGNVLMLLRITPHQVIVIGYGSRLAAPFKQVGARNRITSYNVCYTKLLRFYQAPFAERPPEKLPYEYHAHKHASHELLHPPY